MPENDVPTPEEPHNRRRNDGEGSPRRQHERSGWTDEQRKFFHEVVREVVEYFGITPEEHRMHHRRLGEAIDQGVMDWVQTRMERDKRIIQLVQGVSRDVIGWGIKLLLAVVLLSIVVGGHEAFMNILGVGE